MEKENQVKREEEDEQGAKGPPPPFKPAFWEERQNNKVEGTPKTKKEFQLHLKNAKSLPYMLRVRAAAKHLGVTDANREHARIYAKIAILEGDRIAQVDTWNVGFSSKLRCTLLFPPWEYIGEKKEWYLSFYLIQNGQQDLLVREVVFGLGEILKSLDTEVLVSYEACPRKEVVRLRLIRNPEADEEDYLAGIAELKEKYPDLLLPVEYSDTEVEVPLPAEEGSTMEPANATSGDLPMSGEKADHNAPLTGEAAPSDLPMSGEKGDPDAPAANIVSLQDFAGSLVPGFDTSMPADRGFNPRRGSGCSTASRSSVGSNYSIRSTGGKKFIPVKGTKSSEGRMQKSIGVMKFNKEIDEIRDQVLNLPKPEPKKPVPRQAAAAPRKPAPKRAAAAVTQQPVAKKTATKKDEVPSKDKSTTTRKK